jgi:hypothetical protein
MREIWRGWVRTGAMGGTVGRQIEGDHLGGMRDFRPALFLQRLLIGIDDHTSAVANGMDRGRSTLRADSNEIQTIKPITRIAIEIPLEFPPVPGTQK